MLSPLLGDGKYCGEVTPAELETTGNRFYIKAAGNGNHFRFKLTYRCDLCIMQFLKLINN